jgi:hypothetical protein
MSNVYTDILQLYWIVTTVAQCYNCYTIASTFGAVLPSSLVLDVQVCRSATCKLSLSPVGKKNNAS